MAEKLLKYDVAMKSTKTAWQMDIPRANTGDENTVTFDFNITDLDSAELTGAIPNVNLYMRDGSFFQCRPEEGCELDGQRVTYTMRENEGKHNGKAKAELVLIWPGTNPIQKLTSQQYAFEITNGLDTVVAVEVMIEDWTTLTRDARAYIDQFVADEVFRDAQFDNAQFDRNVAFVSSQESRDLAFGVEQTDRGAAFTTEQTNRNTAFNNAQDARALTFSESESGRTTAENGRVTAEDDRVEAESGRVTKESQRVTAETNRVTAEGNRVTAESGRVTAESGRVTAETNRAAAFTAFDTRLTAEETATAANKISAVKSKTFADVDARIEDVEFDTTMMGTNLVTNGDFSNGITGYVTTSSYVTSTSGELITTATASSGNVRATIITVANNVYYVFAQIQGDSALVKLDYHSLNQWAHSGSGKYGFLSGIVTATTDGEKRVGIRDYRSSGWTLTKMKYLGAIDLTATFGKGNEPTAEQMDGIMAKFTNSWFDGAKNLFRANATLNKLMAIDARTEFEARNGVVNGDFSNGTTGWSSQLQTLTVSNGILSASVENVISRLFTPSEILAGRKYYFKYSNFVPSDVAQVNKFTITTGLNAGIVVDSFTEASKLTPSQSYIFTPTLNASGWRLNMSLYDLTKPFSYTIDNILAIDLTATFGAGKEPTLAEMDRLMARFPNSWFDGAKPIQTIETLYQEKANKVSENWITPTLVNGYTLPNAEYALGYYKDESGVVRMKGRISNGAAGQHAILLPVGYRPKQTLFLACSSTGLNVFSVQILTTGHVVPYQTLGTSYLHLEGISFRAEQ